MQNVHEYTNISNIANDVAYAAIVQIVNECTTEYSTLDMFDASSYAHDEHDELAAALQQRDDDVAYVNAALAQFAVTRNVDELINTIAQQDSFVRDYYAYVVNDLYSDYYNGEWE